MAVLIPSQFAKARKIGVGSIIDLEPVQAVRSKRRRYTLEELVQKYKPKHRHGEWNLGEPVGKEVW